MINAQSSWSNKSVSWALLATMVLTGFLFEAGKANASDVPEITVYKSPTCGCCQKWIEHLQVEGFSVKTEETHDVSAIKDRIGLDARLRSCHTGFVDGYVIEGHVPAGDIRRLLAERPSVIGLSVPGMPSGSPGMEVSGAHADRYQVLSIDEQGKLGVFARH